MTRCWPGLKPLRFGVLSHGLKAVASTVVLLRSTLCAPTLLEGPSVSASSLRTSAFGDGDSNFGDAACVVGFVAEVDYASVGFDDLAGEGEAYSGAGFFCGVEGDEEVLGIGEAWAVVFDRYAGEVAVFGGSYRHFGCAGLCRGLA